jgi:hypothetical protein
MTVEMISLGLRVREICAAIDEPAHQVRTHELSFARFPELSADVMFRNVEWPHDLNSHMACCFAGGNTPVPNWPFLTS